MIEEKVKMSRDYKRLCFMHVLQTVGQFELTKIRMSNLISHDTYLRRHFDKFTILRQSKRRRLVLAAEKRQFQSVKRSLVRRESVTLGCVPNVSIQYSSFSNHAVLKSQRNHVHRRW